MVAKTLVALVVAAAGFARFGWLDGFHLAIGVPVIVAGLLFSRWVWNRSHSVVVPATAETGPYRNAIHGLLLGGLLIPALAGFYRIGERTPVYPLFYDRGASELIYRLSILQEGQAWDAVIATADARLHQRLSASLRARLLEFEVHAQLGRASVLSGPQQTAALRSALATARELGREDVIELASARLSAQESRSAVEALLTASAADRPGDRIVLLSLADSCFSGGSVLNPISHNELQRIAGALCARGLRDFSVLVEGWGGESTSSQAPLRLSQQVQAITTALQQLGVSPDRISYRTSSGPPSGSAASAEPGREACVLVVALVPRVRDQSLP